MSIYRVEILDAARMDQASGVQQQGSITIPAQAVGVVRDLTLELLDEDGLDELLPERLLELLDDDDDDELEELDELLLELELLLPSQQRHPMVR